MFQISLGFVLNVYFLVANAAEIPTKLKSEKEAENNNELQTRQARHVQQQQQATDLQQQDAYVDIIVHRLSSVQFLSAF